MENLAAAAKVIGALGASKGGHARKAKLSKKELSRQGRHAINTRWRNIEAGTNGAKEIMNRARRDLQTA